MELPIPTHLVKYFVPLGSENDAYFVAGQIQCSCGFEDFEVYESNDRAIVKLVCKQCGNEILLFDESQHGWNGYVCKEDELDHTEPFEKYYCADCQQDGFKVMVSISSQGREEFLAEGVPMDASFSEEDWVNAFESISATLLCTSCELQEEDWLEAEVM